MKEEKYLLLLSQKENSFKPLKGKFKEMGAFYTGIRYAFPKKSQEQLGALIEQLPDARLIKQPLPSGHTFESLADWMRELQGAFHAQTIVKS